MVLNLSVCACAGYTRCPWSHMCISGCTSVYLCASSLQNLAVPQDLHFPLSVPLERSDWPCVRWCGTGRYQEQGQCFFIGLSCSIHFGSLLFFHFSSFCLYVGTVRLGSLDWYCVDHYFPALHYRPLLTIIIIIIIRHRRKRLTLELVLRSAPLKQAEITGDVLEWDSNGVHLENATGPHQLSGSCGHSIRAVSASLLPIQMCHKEQMARNNYVDNNIKIINNQIT